MIKTLNKLKRAWAGNDASIITPLNRTLILIVVALAAGVGLWFIAAYSTPFNVYTVHGYFVVPPKACPGVPLEVRLDRTLSIPPFGSVGEYELRTSWVNVASRQSIDLPVADGTFARSELGRASGISPVLREAPGQPGLWRLRTEAIVQGKVLGLPRQDIEMSTSKDVFESLPMDDERCLR